MITRRGFLGALAALPFVSKWLPIGAGEPAVPGRGLYTLPDLSREARICLEASPPGDPPRWTDAPPHRKYAIVELQTLDGPVELDLGELDP